MQVMERHFAKPAALLSIVVSIATGIGPAVAESRLFEKPGVAVEALVDGSGPVVVMIPSLGRPAEDFDDLARRVADAGYTAVRLQPRGIGRGNGPMQNQTLMDLAGDAAFVIETLGGPAIVIGHAFGQREARALAASRPELVRGVVTLAAGGKVPIPEKARLALVACFDTKLSPEQHLENVRTAFFAPGNDASVWRDGWYPETARLQTGATQATPLASWWGAGRAPMLVVQGLQDAIALPENGRSLKAEFGARVTLVEIDGAGHALLPEKPAEIAKAVLKFITRLQAQPK
jgi:pimeloyl-ACP methyl ester carboxylesterase